MSPKNTNTFMKDARGGYTSMLGANDLLSNFLSLNVLNHKTRKPSKDHTYHEPDFTPDLSLTPNRDSPSHNPVLLVLYV